MMTNRYPVEAHQMKMIFPIWILGKQLNWSTKLMKKLPTLKNDMFIWAEQKRLIEKTSTCLMLKIKHMF